MFFPPGNAYWNTYTSDTHSQRQDTHIDTHTHTSGIHTHIYAIAKQKLVEKKENLKRITFFILLKMNLIF